jgi:cytochrome c oxidase cbb3-type subunit III
VTAAARVVLTLLVGSLIACGGERRAEALPRAGGGTAGTTESAARDVSPVGQGTQDSVPTSPAGSAVDSTAGPTLIAHPEHIQPGLSSQRPLATLANPRGHDPRAVEEGKQLFISYNCGDCHGSEGSGAVGPSLQDGRWHFGGTAGEVFESIAEGRPNGMPSWGGRISNGQIWALVAYVRTLSAGKNVTTENFESATVPRGGH